MFICYNLQFNILWWANAERRDCKAAVYSKLTLKFNILFQVISNVESQQCILTDLKGQLQRNL